MGTTRRIGAVLTLTGILLTIVGIVDLLLPPEVQCTVDHDLYLCTRTYGSWAVGLGLVGPMLALIGGLLAIGPVEADDRFRWAGSPPSGTWREPASPLRTGRR